MTRLKKSRTIVYLQNTGFSNSESTNSLVLLCKKDKDDMENIISHASNFIERNHVTYPVVWKEFFEKNPDLYKNHEGEFIADKLNKNCMIIGNMYFKSGHVYGGKTGDKFISYPEFHIDFLPLKSKKKYPIIMSICKFEGSHKCDIHIWKGKIKAIMNYQNEIAKMLIKRDISKWKKSSHRIKNEMIEKLKSIEKTS